MVRNRIRQLGSGRRGGRRSLVGRRRGSGIGMRGNSLGSRGVFGLEARRGGRRSRVRRRSQSPGISFSRRKDQEGYAAHGAQYVRTGSRRQCLTKIDDPKTAATSPTPKYSCTDATLPSSTALLIPANIVAPVIIAVRCTFLNSLRRQLGPKIYAPPTYGQFCGSRGSSGPSIITTNRSPTTSCSRRSERPSTSPEVASLKLDIGPV